MERLLTDENAARGSLGRGGGVEASRVRGGGVEASRVRGGGVEASTAAASPAALLPGALVPITQAARLADGARRPPGGVGPLARYPGGVARPASSAAMRAGSAWPSPETGPTRTRAMRRASISVTVRRWPFTSTVSPTAGSRPSADRT